jgi:hypothetical protein
MTAAARRADDAETRDRVLRAATELFAERGFHGTKVRDIAALAGANVAMSDSLRITTVAEGIEDAEQATRMRILGCSYGQGYFFARPMAGDAIAPVVNADPTPELAGPTPLRTRRIEPGAAVARFGTPAEETGAA